jgi:hypothetical protein
MSPLNTKQNDTHNTAAFCETDSSQIEDYKCGLLAYHISLWGLNMNISILSYLQEFYK